MHHIYILLIYVSSQVSHPSLQLESVNLVLNQLNIQAEFIERPIPFLGCESTDSVSAWLFCLRQSQKRHLIASRQIPAYPVILTPERYPQALGSYTGRYCANIGVRKDPTFITASVQDNPSATAHALVHEVLHALGARHQPTPDDVMYPYGGRRSISEVYTSNVTRKQVRRCLVRLKYLQRKEQGK